MTEQHPALALGDTVGSYVANAFSRAANQLTRTGLQRLNVDIVDGAVAKVTDGTVHLRSGTAFASDLTLWAIVSGVPDLAARSGLTVDEQGRAHVDAYLRSVDDERIIVVGDCAAVPRARFSCQLATPQAAHAADTLARLVKGRAPRPFAVRYRARAVTLGRKNAVGQFTRRDDTLRRIYLTGRIAVMIRELASRGGRYGARTGFYA